MSWFVEFNRFLNRNLSLNLNLPVQRQIKNRITITIKSGTGQCRCGPPRPQPQPPAGFAAQLGPLGAASPPAEANTENFLASFDDPQ